MQVLTIINFAAAIQGLFLSYLLVHKKAASTEHKILALLVLVMSSAMLGAVLGLSGYYRELPHLTRVGDPLVLLFGPLLYFYIHLLTRGQMPRRFGFHLLPFALYALSLIPYYVMSGAEKIAFVEKVFMDKQNNLQVAVIQLIRSVHVTIYVLASVWLLRKFERFIKDNYSDIDKINLDKAAVLLKLFVILTVFRIGLYLTSIVVHLNFVLTNNIISLMTSVVIYALAYSLWNRHVRLDFPMPPAVPVQPVAASNSAETMKSRSVYFLSDEQCAALSKKLEQLFQQEQLYLESELSLAQLSDKMGVPTYQASELINRVYQEPFFDFINRKRIEAVKMRLNDAAYDHYSILGIAMDCGFNSKSSFNTAFKKFTGSTPSEYRRK